MLIKVCQRCQFWFAFRLFSSFFFLILLHLFHFNSYVFQIPTNSALLFSIIYIYIFSRRTWDTRVKLKYMSYFPGDVNSISYNADGNSLVSGSIDKYVKIWSVRQNQGQITSSLSGPVQSVMCVKVPSNSCFLFLLNLFGCSHLFLFPFSLFFCLFWFPLIM